MAWLRGGRFQERYRAAWLRYRNGERDVAFPEGTYWMLVVPRPQHFFRADGEMPELVSLELCPPPCVGDPARFVHDAQALQVIAEKQHRAEAKAKRRRFVGREKILALRRTDSPKTREPRRGLSPRIACRDKWKRIEALQREQQFQERYRAAWLRYRDGERDVAFPDGTYWMVVVAKQPCEGSRGLAPA